MKSKGEKIKYAENEKILIFRKDAKIELIRLEAFHKLTGRNITCLLQGGEFIGMFEDENNNF